MPNEPVPPSKPTPKPSDTVGLRVSLIPEDEMQRADPEAGFRAWRLAFTLGLIVLLLACGAVWAQVWNVGHQVAALEVETAAYADRDAQTTASWNEARRVQTQVKGIASLVTAHRYPTQVLAFLERHTLPTVAFQNAAFTDDGTISLSAEARDYEALASQVEEFRSDPLVRSVSISGISGNYAEEGLAGVLFGLTISTDPAIFVRAH